MLARSSILISYVSMLYSMGKLVTAIYVSKVPPIIGQCVTIYYNHKHKGKYSHPKAATTRATIIPPTINPIRLINATFILVLISSFRLLFA